VTLPTDERLRRLAAWRDRFADPSFSFGHWVPATTGDDGVIHVGWFEIGAEGQKFVSEMYELGWVYDFDWMTWLGTAEGQALSAAPETVAAADGEDLAKLLTAIVRSERFGDGQLEGALKSGLLLAIARRAGELQPLG
jgi:hypothetical protein